MIEVPETNPTPDRVEEEDRIGPVAGISEPYVLFESNGGAYAIALASVREVVISTPFSRIPRAPPSSIGLMNHGGRVYTIVDLAALFLHEDAVPREQVLLLDDPCRLLGIAVDRVEGIGPLKIEEEETGLQNGSMTLVTLDSIVREVDAAFEASSMLVSPNRLNCSAKEF